MLLGIFKISGHSMLPNLKPNDRIIVSSLPFIFSKPKVGDAVVIKNIDKLLIKRISKISDGSIFLKGDNNLDSLKIGSVKPKDIKGKAILRLRGV